MLDAAQTPDPEVVAVDEIDGARAWRWGLLVIVVVIYAALTVAVVVGSPLDALDRRVAGMELSRHWPDLTPWVLRYVVIAQRAPSAAVAAAYLLWRSWRLRSSRPLVTLLTALVLLNLSVGAVKVATGRLGPLLTSHPRAVFDGGDIFPSGHVSNAVVVFGVLALLSSDRHRWLIAELALLGATTIGLSTIFLDTHWVTDVIGGWLAGGLVLLILPGATVCAYRMTFSVIMFGRRRGAHRARAVRKRRLQFGYDRSSAKVQAVPCRRLVEGVKLRHGVCGYARRQIPPAATWL